MKGAAMVQAGSIAIVNLACHDFNTKLSPCLTVEYM